MSAQPQVCGEVAAMTSFCADACVICDIDGFTGINDLTAEGQGFDEFCTTQYNNMQYIAFIAGTEDLTIQVDVGTCVGGLGSLEVGFFQSSDCENFIAITDCDTDIPSNASTVFSNFDPLVVGQYYYLVIDGSNGANCDWTFNVIEGSTEVLPLEDSGILSNTELGCPEVPVTFATTGEFGAANYLWTVDGISQSENGLDLTYQFPADGIYEICVIASNVCDEAPPTCTTVELISPQPTIIDEVLCNGECVEANGVQFCETGFYEEIIDLNGCDSLITINILVLEQAETNIDLWICNDQSYSVGTSTYNETGSYLDTVQTSADCDSLVFLELLVIECEIVGDTDEIPALCTGTATGTLIFSVEQGTPPLTFTYTNIEDGTITGTGMTNLLIDNEIPGIPAGTYQIYITDNFGNDGVVLQEVTEPLPLAVTLASSDFNGFNVSCFSDQGLPGDDGTLTAAAFNGTQPYDYLWSNGLTDQMITGLSAQTYTVTVTDANECVLIQEFTLTSPPPILASIQFDDPNCDGEDTGEITIESVTGGTPEYMFSLTDTAFFDQMTFTQLEEGEYQVFIQDANGCVQIVDGSLTAADIPEIYLLSDTIICLGEEVQLQPELLVDFLSTLTWTNTSTLSCEDCLEPIASPVNEETYTLTVMSIDSCFDAASIIVKIDKKRRVFVPNIFTPNDDGLNDLFYPFGGIEVEKILTFSVYDRWGNHLYEVNDFAANDSSFGWNGTFNGEKVQAGVFAWIANVLFLDGEEMIYSGSVTVTR